MEDIRTRNWLRRHTSRRRILQAGALGAAGLWLPSLTGCSPSQTARTDSTPSSSGSASVNKIIDKLTVAIGDEPPSLDAHKAIGNVAIYFTTNVCEGLIDRDLSGKTIPALATSWKLLPDGKGYEFKLRQGVKFHNGDPMTAEDVEFTFKRLKDPKIYPKQSELANWDACEVVDPYTVRFVFKKADPTFLGYISYGFRWRILPKKYYDQVGDSGFEKAPVATGPYKFVRRTVKESWELEAFDGYWGNKPAVKHAIFKIIPEAVTLAAVLKTGEVDFVSNYPPTFLEDIGKTPGMKVVKNKSYNTIDFRINVRRETDPETGKPNPWRDTRVRQAMNYAVDKDAIINNILKGMGEKIAVMFPEDVGYDPNLKPYPYDPKKAKDLLAEAGFPNGLDATYYGLLGERIPMSKEVGEAVVNYLNAIGMRTKVVNEEYALWLNRTSPDVAPELYPFGYGMTFVGGQFHPGYGFRVLAGCGGSTSWYCNKELDALTDQMYEESDPAKVEELVKKGAKIIHDDAAVLMLYRNVVAYAMKDAIDFTPTPNSQYIELVNVKPKA